MAKSALDGIDVIIVTAALPYEQKSGTIVLSVLSEHPNAKLAFEAFHEKLLAKGWVDKEGKPLVPDLVTDHSVQPKKKKGELVLVLRAWRGQGMTLDSLFDMIMQ